MLQDIHHASVARDEFVALQRECVAILEQKGPGACVAILVEEATRYFVRMGTLETTARASLQDYIAGLDDPIVVLRQLVAEQRTVERLGLSGDAAAALTA